MIKNNGEVHVPVVRCSIDRKGFYTMISLEVQAETVEEFLDTR